MITIRSPLKKTLLLLTLTTLTISLGASISFNSPTDGDVFDSDAEISVDPETENTIDNVTFRASGPDGQDEFTLSEESSDNFTGTFNKGDAGGTNGEYNLEAELYTGESSEGKDEISVTMETSGPDVDISDGVDFVQSDPEFVFDVSDDYSDIADVSASASSSDGDVSVDVSDNCSSESSCEVDVEADTGDLSDGDEFTVDVEATDEAGNTGDNGGDSFTLDDAYDGDSSASVEWDESGSNVLSGFSNEDQDVVVSLDEGDSVSDTSVECWIDGEEVDSDSADMTDGDSEEFSCEADSDYSGSRFDLSVEVEDEVGNGESVVDSKEMIWDASAPNIDGLEQPNSVSTFNSDFGLSFSATDDASGIQNVEYYFDANTEVGEGNSVSVEEPGSVAVDKDIDVVPGSLDQGNHTVYLRVEDGAGQTEVSSFDFEYYPDREPEINLEAPGSFEVVSGESKSFTLSIENGAPFYLDGVEVSGEGAVWSGSKTASSLKDGESVEKEITVDASDLDVGTYDLMLETSDYSSSKTVEVIVRASESQKQEIEQSLNKWNSTRSELEENISRIDTLEPDNENITSFTSKVENAQQAVDSGNHYKAKSYLQNIDSSFSQASETFTEKEEEHRKNQRKQLFMILLGGFILMGSGAAGFVAYREGFELEDLKELKQIEYLEEIQERMPDEFNLPINDLPVDIPETSLVDKVRELIDFGEDEEEEKDIGYSFDDFK